MRSPVRCAALAALWWLASLGAAWADERDELRRLVDQIARGSEFESADAGEQLIERLVGPVAEALESLSARPVEEQRRIRAVLSRVSSGLRLRLFRAELTAEEARLLDRFSEQYRDLVYRLFDPNFRVRLDALDQIPLQRETAAGLLIAARINDEDEEVALSALRIAANLHDRVLARRIIRYVRDALEALRTGALERESEGVADTVALFVGRCCVILGACEEPAAAPVLIEALQYFPRSRYKHFFAAEDVAEALAAIGDEQAAPAILPLLDDPTVVAFSGTDSARIEQRVSDVALLSLLRIYRLPLEPFGFESGPSAQPRRSAQHVLTPDDFSDAVADRVIHGFRDDRSRAQARRAFLEWRRVNADLPPAQRSVPASQPTTQPAQPANP